MHLEDAVVPEAFVAVDTDVWPLSRVDAHVDLQVGLGSALLVAKWAEEVHDGGMVYEVSQVLRFVVEHLPAYLALDGRVSVVMVLGAVAVHLTLLLHLLRANLTAVALLSFVIG